MLTHCQIEELLLTLVEPANTEETLYKLIGKGEKRSLNIRVEERWAEENISSAAVMKVAKKKFAATPSRLD
jgi:hypothetical protein